MEKIFHNFLLTFVKVKGRMALVGQGQPKGHNIGRSTFKLLIIPHALSESNHMSLEIQKIPRS